MDFNDIVKKYGNELGIIINIDRLIDEISNRYSKEELINLLKYIINYNNDIYNIIKTKNSEKNNSNIQNNQSIVFPNNLKSINSCNNNSSIDNSGNNLDVSKYINFILENNNEQEIINILPLLDNIDFDNILFSVKCKILEYIFLFKKELMNDDLNVSDKTYYQNQIDLLQFKLNIVKNYHTNIKQNGTITNKRNKLIFLNNNEKILFFDDLKDINDNDYPVVYSLLNSIVYGTFTNPKYFNNNENLKGIFEVRDIKTGQRVMYNRIYQDYYVIIFVFSKDGYQNSIYRERLKNRADIFYNNEETIKTLLKENDSEFINYQSQLQKNILEILKQKDNDSKKKKRGALIG